VLDGIRNRFAHARSTADSTSSPHPLFRANSSASMAASSTDSIRLGNVNSFISDTVDQM
jgi:hypothetical protein